MSFKDIVDICRKICKAFGLDHVARNRLIDLALTLDGAQLTNKLSFVMAGLKMIDLAVRNPETGVYELNHSACSSKDFTPQSRSWCFPLKLCMGKESERMYQEEFCEMFELFRKAGMPMQDIFEGWKGVQIVNPADMAAIQKILGIGGAAKVYKFFCHCCPLTSANIVKPNSGAGICERCAEKQENRPSWQCFHVCISNEEQTKKYETALAELMDSWSHDMEQVRAHGKLKLGAENDKNSVDFVPNSIEESLDFVSLLRKEMRLRGKQANNKSLSQLQAELRECLQAEKNMDELVAQISESTTRAEAIERIMAFVPCIMHCENRVGLKILTMILIEGLSNYQGKKFDHLNNINSLKAREELYVKNIEKEMRSSILGSYGSEAQWSLPLEKRTVEGERVSEIGTISMENYKVRKCIDNIDNIIDLSITDEERKNKLRECLRHYRRLMEIMRKKDGDYRKEELRSFVEHTDEFFQLWVELYGRQGVTNYIHMIGSGHFEEYMVKWGNLNKYSQQGWEALNALIKLFFFRRTNKGGHNSGGDVTNLKSKLVPIGRLVQRRMLWVCNLVPENFFEDDYVLPTVQEEDIITDNDDDDIILDINTLE